MQKAWLGLKFTCHGVEIEFIKTIKPSDWVLIFFHCSFFLGLFSNNLLKFFSVFRGAETRAYICVIPRRLYWSHMESWCYAIDHGSLLPRTGSRRATNKSNLASIIGTFFSRRDLRKTQKCDIAIVTEIYNQHFFPLKCFWLHCFSREVSRWPTLDK